MNADWAEGSVWVDGWMGEGECGHTASLRLREDWIGKISRHGDVGG